MTDPVCGMDVTPEDAAGSYRYKGEQYYFLERSHLYRKMKTLGIAVKE